MSEVTAKSTPINIGVASRWFDGWWKWLEPRLEKAGDYLNPILVKETRQAIKSRQFALTFVMLLIACWGVTIGGVAIAGPGIRYMATGGQMLLYYYCILVFPLAVIVPFAAFRSLASERDENTYDLLAVSTLTPRQIINGKLGSAIVQMGVYLSVISPCIAFTYLLRGVDVVTILILLGDAVLGCLGLAMIALFMAAVSNQKHGQVVISVILVAGLLGAFMMAVTSAIEITRYGAAITGDSEFWAAMLFGLTLYATTFAILYFAAAGLISFASANRSTPIRKAVFAQQVCLLAWMAFIWISEQFDNDFLAFGAAAIGLYWSFAGALLTGESSILTRRVRRDLPQTTLGRVFLTWFQPGSGTGYLFAIANVTGWAFLLVAAATFVESWRGPQSYPPFWQLAVALALGVCYIVAYLGIGRLIVAALRRWTVVSLLGAFLINFLLVLAGCGIPYVIQQTTTEWKILPFHYLEITNPLWVLGYILGSARLPTETLRLLILIPGAAICIFLVNLPSVLYEMRQSRLELPQRVVEDEVELHPPPEALPSSPWDEG